MAEHWRTSLDPVLYPADQEVEAGSSAVAWSAIWAGTVAAIGVSLILLTIGSGLGLATVSPWPGAGPRPATFSIGAGIWLIVMQWISSSVGGYLAGRMRTRWNGLHTHEVFFRDTAHGLITWAMATIVVAGVAALTTSLAGTAVPDVDAMEVTREAADQARKVASTVALFTGLSMLVGAFIASVSAALGGQLRDKHP